MILVLRTDVTQKQIDDILKFIKERNLTPHISKGTERTIIGLIGDERQIIPQMLEALPGVEQVIPILQPFKLASREFHREDTIIEVGNVKIGGNNFVVMAGPCSVEGEEKYLKVARIVKEAGAHILRGGAFKPRTSPYDFQGLGKRGLEIMAKAREETGMPIVTEVMDTRDVELVAEYADIMQIGARNVQNFALLKEVGKLDKPVLLKRGMSTTIKEWLMSAEYILKEGNEKVILCERGIRTFETYTRNTLDLSAIAVVKHLSHLPVISDPSHGTGKWRWVPPMSKASIAAGADGLMIEVHNKPEEAFSDGPQSLKPDKFSALMEDIRKLLDFMGKKY